MRYEGDLLEARDVEVGDAVYRAAHGYCRVTGVHRTPMRRVVVLTIDTGRVGRIDSERYITRILASTDLLLVRWRSEYDRARRLRIGALDPPTKEEAT